MLKLNRAIGTKEYRLTITFDGNTRTYTFLAENEDAAWEQVYDTIEAPGDPLAVVAMRRVA